MILEDLNLVALAPTPAATNKVSGGTNAASRFTSRTLPIDHLVRYVLLVRHACSPLEVCIVVVS